MSLVLIWAGFGVAILTAKAVLLGFMVLVDYLVKK